MCKHLQNLVAFGSVLALVFLSVIRRDATRMESSIQESVTRWIADLKAGESQAAAQLWQRYFADLVELARRRLGSAPKRVSDEEDVALSVFNSLCNGAVRGHFNQLSDRQDLWRLLLVITKQKAVD